MFISKNIRGLLIFTLALASGSAFAQSVTVVEFYNRTLDAYFITGRLPEQQSLDALSDFRRTGMSFEAVAAAASTPATKRICRFYISLTTPPTSTPPQNPRPVALEIELGPVLAQPRLTTAIRLGATQAVIGVAQLSDGTLWQHAIEVLLTGSACFDGT